MFWKKKKEAVQKVTVDERLQHIAFIMDGNGRWAKKQMKPREYGHSVGAKKFREIVQHCADVGVEYVTVYAFSTENWKRPEEEVEGLISLDTKELCDGIIRNLRMEISPTERINYYNKYIRRMRLDIDDKGIMKIKVQEE